MESKISCEESFEWDFIVKNKRENYEKKVVLYFMKQVILIGNSSKKFQNKTSVSFLRA